MMAEDRQKQERQELKRARARMRRTPAHEQLRQAREELRREAEANGYIVPRVPIYRGGLDV